MKPTSKSKASGGISTEQWINLMTIVDFYLSKEREEKAAQTFLRKAISISGLPEKVVIDKRDATTLNEYELR